MRPHSLFITGASSGIGRALALEYARGGAKLAVAARRVPELETLAHEIRELGGDAMCIALDVSDTDAVNDALRRADRDLGGIEMVIANAGVGSLRHSSQLTWQDVAAILDVNMTGAMATLVAAIPIFLAHQRGHLVGISSLAGRRALPRAAAYSASKAALSTFLESLRLDLAPSGVHVTDVRPGYVATPMTKGATHARPFCWPVDKAVRHIAFRLERAPCVIAFPWQLALATSIARLLPASIYDRLIRVSRA
jgi:short-subunit dehydrogenase